jgi:SAM-dependent methyltransferase
VRLVGDWGERIPDFVPPDLDPVHAAEIARYNHIAAAGPGAYAGHTEAKPELRARVVRGMLRPGPFVEVGPGFGELLRATEGERYAVDHSLAVLEPLADLPGVRCARALGERLPFEDVPQIVADSVFQTVPDRERLLCEAWRALEPGGQFIFSIGYRWNYPRRPQEGFDVRTGEGRVLLRRYLDELFEVERWAWYSLGEERWVRSQRDADYLYVVARKRG